VDSKGTLEAQNVKDLIEGFVNTIEDMVCTHGDDTTLCNTSHHQHHRMEHPYKLDTRMFQFSSWDDFSKKSSYTAKHQMV